MVIGLRHFSERPPSSLILVVVLLCRRTRGDNGISFAALAKGDAR
jgi:hypothetical protein